MPATLDQGAPLGTKIYRLVYRSRVLEPLAPPYRERETADILRVSVGWNYSNGITGALLLSHTGYSQVLEGPPQAVKSLFGHIACDVRHQDVELLYNEYDSERDFANWAMAVVASPDEETIELASTAYKRDIVLSDGADDIRMMLRWLLIDEPLLNNSPIGKRSTAPRAAEFPRLKPGLRVGRRGTE